VFCGANPCGVYMEGKMFKEMSVDWNKYRDIFPDRYHKPSVFDRVFRRLVSRRTCESSRKIRVLDIGGGLYGNLFSSFWDYYLLDPGVSATDGNTFQVSWNEATGIEYDFIRMKGSIAYLSDEELRVVSSMLKPETVLAFNTFRHFGDPIKIRRYSSNSGRGKEIVEADLKNGIVKHTLDPEGVEGVYVSQFYIRTVEEYFDILDPNRDCCVVQGWKPPNSVWVTMGRGHHVSDLGL